jgi:hypothetical protein
MGTHDHSEKQRANEQVWERREGAGNSVRIIVGTKVSANRHNNHSRIRGSCVQSVASFPQKYGTFLELEMEEALGSAGRKERKVGERTNAGIPATLMKAKKATE